MSEINIDPNALRIELIETLLRLPADRLALAAEALRRCDKLVLNSAPAIPVAAGPPASVKDWPHAPRHGLDEHGAYMVTAGTYRKAHVFRDNERLALLESQLLLTARRYDWHLEAWAIFSNHYHFVGYSTCQPARLREFLTELHANTAREVNLRDGQEGRKVWHNFWDKHLTYEKSYLARLNYVHQNAVKHGLVPVANQYPWCSAAWLEQTARPAQVRTIYSFKIDLLKVSDDFEPLRIV